MKQQTRIESGKMEPLAYQVSLSLSFRRDEYEPRLALLLELKSDCTIDEKEGRTEFHSWCSCFL